jgi:nitrite reductase/ring-hydroxylating ferredoxin subunit
MAVPVPGTVVCRLDELPDGAGRMFSFGEGDEVFRVLVLRSGDTVLGYENRCPHFGIPFAQRDEHLIVKAGESFSCNTHYARFRWRDGYCDLGDCEGESVPAVALTVADGEIRFA